MKKMAQYVLGLSVMFATTVYAQDNIGTPDDPTNPGGGGMGLSADFPGLLALGAIALIIGVRIARRNKR